MILKGYQYTIKEITNLNQHKDCNLKIFITFAVVEWKLQIRNYKTLFRQATSTAPRRGLIFKIYYGRK